MNLESPNNPNDLQPPPRVTGSLILIHAITGLCCGVIGITQALQPDLIASMAVPGYEGPSVPQSIKIAAFISMAPLPLLVILEAMAGIGLIIAGRRAVSYLQWWSILRAGLAALALLMGILFKQANIDFQVEMYEAMSVAIGSDEFLPNSLEEIEQSYNFTLLVGLLLGMAAPVGVGLWLMGGRGQRLQKRLDVWRVATGGRAIWKALRP